jgi:hypothetical protein
MTSNGTVTLGGLPLGNAAPTIINLALADGADLALQENETVTLISAAAMTGEKGVEWEEGKVELVSDTGQVYSFSLARNDNALVATLESINDAASIDIATAAFDKREPADVAVTLDSGTYEFENIVYDGKPLTRGEDYIVDPDDGNKYIIKKEFFAALSNDVHVLTFDMNGGSDPKLTVTVSEGVNAKVTPTAVTFDKYAPADVVVALDCGDYQFEELLFEGVEDLYYKKVVDGTRIETFTFAKEDLMSLADGVYMLTFVMDGGVSPTLTLTVTDSTPPTPVTPTSHSSSSNCNALGVGIFVLFGLGYIAKKK